MCWMRVRSDDGIGDEVLRGARIIFRDARSKNAGSGSWSVDVSFTDATDAVLSSLHPANPNTQFA